MVDETIVQDIEIEGADAAAGEFQKVGDAAELGLGKIDKAADSATAALGKLSTHVDDTAKKTGTGLKAAGDGAAGLKQLETAALNAGQAFGKFETAAASFGKAVGLIGGAAVGAIGGIILLAKSLNAQLHASDETGKSTKQLTQEYKAQTQVFTQQAVAAVGNARAFSELNHQLVQGTISTEDYFKQNLELHRTQENAKQDALQVAAIEEEATRRRLETVRQLQQEQEKRKILNDLIKKFGADLTNSLLRLGNTAEDFWRQFTSGPSTLARGVDIINDVLERTGTKLLGFYQRIGKAIAGIFNLSDGQKGIDEFSDRVIAFGEEVTTIFEKVIAPAIKSFIGIVQTVADAINGLFGTNVSAGGLIFFGILIKITGAFGLLTTAIGFASKALQFLFLLIIRNPIGLILTALALLAVFLLTKVDWKQFASDAQTAIRNIVKKWEELKQSATDAWEWVKTKALDAWQVITDKWDAMVAFFDSIWQPIRNAATDAWDWIKQTSADAWQFIVDKWNAMVQFFADLWQGIKDKSQEAWDFVSKGFSDAWQRALAFLQPVLDKLGAIWDMAKNVAQAIGLIQSPSRGDSSSDDGGFAGGGEVRGPGTSTSDSIWARVSRGEFVVRAAAVQRYGVSWLHAINEMRANIPKFRDGGLVQMIQQPMLIPALAGGGQVSRKGTGRPIVLNIGGESFHLITNDGDTAEKLGRFATKRRMVAAGRKPAYYGGERQ